MGFYDHLSDEEFLKKKFRVIMGRELDLQNPKTYNEKLQWLKLHDRKPIYTSMVDKYEAKGYVAKAVGEQYIIPTLGVWNRFDDIDFDSLPPQFVLKCTHDSGGLIVCKDKAGLDRAAAKRKIDRCLKRDYYLSGREWAYKNIKPRIIAEKYMEDDSTHDLRDYKFFTFGGVAKVLLIATDRGKAGEETKSDFFDMDFNHLPFTNGHPNAPVTPPKPQKFDEMKALAEKLSAGIPHLRVDFYQVNGQVYFGELTFAHWSGMKPFCPEQWDEKFGSWIDLSGVQGECDL